MLSHHSHDPRRAEWLEAPGSARCSVNLVTKGGMSPTSGSHLWGRPVHRGQLESPVAHPHQLSPLSRIAEVSLSTDVTRTGKVKASRAGKDQVRPRCSPMAPPCGDELNRGAAPGSLTRKRKFTVDLFWLVYIPCLLQDHIYNQLWVRKQC